MKFLFCRISTIWLHDLAAFVQMAREGNGEGDGLFFDGMNGRWTRIWT